MHLRLFYAIKIYLLTYLRNSVHWSRWKPKRKISLRRKRNHPSD